MKSWWVCDEPGGTRLEQREFARDLLPALADGRIRPRVDRVFPFESLPEAIAYMESDRHLGKIVLDVAGRQ